MGDSMPVVDGGREWNPIVKVPVVVSSDSGSVFIDEILVQELENDDGHGNRGGGNDQDAVRGGGVL